MFQSIMHNWRVARGAVLKRDTYDAVQRLAAYGDEFNAQVALHMAATCEETAQRFGGKFDNLSNRGKRQLAKQIRTESKRLFDLNMPAGYGMGLFGVMLEAEATPGDDAAESLAILSAMLEHALTTFREVEAQKP